MRSSTCSRMCACGAVIVLALVTAPLGADAQTLVNQTFDLDVSGWTAWGDASLAWDPLDAAGSPASGSAFVTNLATTPHGATGAYQCVDGVQEGHWLGFGAQVLIPDGQAGTGDAYLLIQWYSAAACQVQISNFSTSSVLWSTPDVFRPVSGWQVAPAGAISARVTLSIRRGDVTGTIAANFDDVYLIDALFFDDFETGNTDMWSSTVPGR